MQPFGVNLDTIMGAFLSILGPLGTILGPLGTIFEIPFPRFGHSADFERFSGNLLTPPGIPFSPLGDTFSLRGASEAENRCFFR